MRIHKLSKTTALSSSVRYIPKVDKVWRSCSRERVASFWRCSFNTTPKVPVKDELVSKIVSRFSGIIQINSYKVFSVIIREGVAV